MHIFLIHGRIVFVDKWNAIDVIFVEHDLEAKEEEKGERKRKRKRRRRKEMSGTKREKEKEKI